MSTNPTPAAPVNAVTNSAGGVRATSPINSGWRNLIVGLVLDEEELKQLKGLPALLAAVDKALAAYPDSWLADYDKCQAFHAAMRELRALQQEMK